MKLSTLISAVLALLILSACSQDTIIDLKHKIDALEKEVEIERATHERLQTYIDNVLQEGGPDFSKGRDGRDPTRVYSRAVLPDTVIKTNLDPRVKDFEDALNEALEDMVNNGLKVTRVNNQIYLTVAEKLLFESGETKLSPRGINNIDKMARLLSSQKDLLIVVEGHTDNIPVVRIPGIEDNWVLSVLRATQVTRKLIKGGVSPESILAAGRGAFHPIALNDSDGRRYLNRRTEIILTPAFD